MLTSFDPSALEYISNPYAVYDNLRQNDPVHYSKLGFWLLTKYEDVVFALKDARLSNQPSPFAALHVRNKDKYTAADVANRLIAFQDPPVHTRPRQLIAQAFQEYIQNQERKLILLAEECADGINFFNGFDFVNDFAKPFSAQALCQIMGYPRKDMHLIQEWTSLFFFLFHAIPDQDTFSKLNVAVKEFRDYTLNMVRIRMDNPQGDLLSFLVDRIYGGMPEMDLVDNIMLLAADGIENVWAGLSSSIAILLQNSINQERLQSDREFVSLAIDECLRLESPSQYQGRIATEAINIGGKEIRSRSIVLLGLAAANRDPAIFVNSSCFNPMRDGPKHLAFGLGRHACIGSSLVKLELSVAVRTVFSRFQGLSLISSDFNWLGRSGHRWLSSLPVALT
jgi:pimeloyl-[acyl-carrier protein] synthase